jgi:hypothetical protein
MQVPQELRRRIGNQKPKFEDQYTYVTSVAALNAGTTDTFNLQIEADAYFVITKMSYMADIAGGAQTEDTRVIPLVRVLITDTGSGRNLMSQAVDISSLAGHEGLPFVTPVARWIAPNSAVNIQFSNYSNATNYANVSLYLHGKKLWF